MTVRLLVAIPDWPDWLVGEVRAVALAVALTLLARRLAAPVGPRPDPSLGCAR